MQVTVNAGLFTIGALLFTFGFACNLIGVFPGGKDSDGGLAPATRRSESPVSFRNNVRFYIFCGIMFMAAAFIPKEYADPEFLEPLKRFFEFGAKYYD